MPGRFSLYPDLSVYENLRFFASVFGTTVEKERPNIAPIYSQLEPFKDRRAAALSGGMKQKLALCCALVHRPEILLLDEPTTGVDAVSRREFWDLLAELKKTGMTILVSTPYMDEADRCDRVALIQGGRLLALDTPQRDRAVVRSPAARDSRRTALPGAARAARIAACPHRLSVRRHAFITWMRAPASRRRRLPSELRAFLAVARVRRRDRSSRPRRPSKTASSRGWAPPMAVSAA